MTDFSWIDFDQLGDVHDLIVETLSAEGTEEFIVEERIEIIAESVLTRIEHVRELSMAQIIAETDSLKDDVQENIAEDYSPRMTM